MGLGLILFFSTVHSVHGDSLASTVRVGTPGQIDDAFPTSVLFDPINDNIYVGDVLVLSEPPSPGGSIDAPGLSVISGSNNTIIANVPVPGNYNSFSPAGLAFDSDNGGIYMVNSYGTTVISDSTNKVVASLAVGGSDIAFDPVNGEIYVTSPPRSPSQYYASNAVYAILPATISVTCDTSNFVVGSFALCTASLTHTNATIAGNTVTFSKTGGTANVTFSPPGCTLSADGTCSVLVMGSTTGNFTLQASYPGDSNDSPALGFASLSVTTTAVPEFPNYVLPSTIAISMVLVASLFRLEKRRARRLSSGTKIDSSVRD